MRLANACWVMCAALSLSACPGEGKSGNASHSGDGNAGTSAGSGGASTGGGTGGASTEADARCTGGQSKECLQCQTDHCATEIDACYGQGKDSVCAAFVDCLCGCDVGDDACHSTCSMSQTPDCKTCNATIGPCYQKNCATACGGTNGSGM